MMTATPDEARCGDYLALYIILYCRFFVNMFPVIFFAFLTKYYEKMKETTFFGNLFGRNVYLKQKHRKEDCRAAVLSDAFLYVYGKISLPSSCPTRSDAA